MTLQPAEQNTQPSPYDAEIEALEATHPRGLATELRTKREGYRRAQADYADLLIACRELEQCITELRHDGQIQTAHLPINDDEPIWQAVIAARAAISKAEGRNA